MSYTLLKHPNDFLRAKCENVNKIDEKVHYVAKRMFQVMYSNKGIGLAANQIGSSYRMLIIDTIMYENGVRLTLLNPEITSHSDETIKGMEGCLSCPGQEREVERWKEISVKGIDLDGEELKLNLSDVSARVIQQELDHLDGILIIDK